MIQVVRVAANGHDQKGQELLHEIMAMLGIESISNIHTVKVYRFEGITHEQAEELARECLCDPVTESCFVNGVITVHSESAPSVKVEVGYRPGVMNPETTSLMKLAHDRGMKTILAADSSREYHFAGCSSEELERIVDQLLVNKTVEHVISEEPETLVISDVSGDIQTVPITQLDTAGLEALSQERHLFLTLQEMLVIQEHFRELDREPTDGELETLAQTWSEHCGHKTFRARLMVDGQEKEPLITRLRQAAALHQTGVVSSFEDNSGVIYFADGYGACGKVETHNSPSAIEPYGGAMTGSGGVFRDIMGTGQGAKVIASTDMFCFAPPNLASEKLPAGCLHPRYLFRRVVAGVRDYGNRMGIPTNNGSVHFHPDFRAKPSVIVGSYGLIPLDRAHKGVPRVGDLVIAVGGRTGRDGIHGATFSSGEMTAQTSSVNASAVQIGNAIEEKRMADALLRCRDEGLVRAITDCGAGGFASAIGEMGAKTGVRVELEKAPLKYPGLAPWEIWLSESQERMVLAVPPESAERVLALCREHNVEATILGQFTDDMRLTVNYNSALLCDLSMEFLHDGLPQRVMTARKPLTSPQDQETNVSQPTTQEDWLQTIKGVLAHGNVCSKEPIARMYDHGVQGTCALPPFSGVRHDGPNDAVVLTPLLGKPYGLVISHGLNPVLNQIDPFGGSLWAGVEALSNYVAVGGNFRTAGLIDNFIWPFPDEESLWDLDQSVEACLQLMHVFGIPFVSGKDSLSSTYRKGSFALKIPPVLCISVFGPISNVEQTVTSDFKRGDSSIVMVGQPDTRNLGGSVYYDTKGVLGQNVPQLNMQGLPALFDWLHRSIVSGAILSCHDISEGGMITAVAEMCFGGKMGAEIQIPSEYEGRRDHWLFHETAGCFLLEVSKDRLAELQNSVGQIPFTVVGKVSTKLSPSPDLTVSHNNHSLFSVPVDELRESWQRPMREVFHA